MNRDKFLTTRDKKIKSTKEKADALYNNLSQTNLSYGDSNEHLYKELFKLLQDLCISNMIYLYNIFIHINILIFHITY